MTSSTFRLYWCLPVIVNYAVGEILTVTCSDYSYTRDLNKVLFCPTDVVAAAREAAKWPENPVTLDSSKCVGYNKLLDVEVHDQFRVSTGGEHANCLGESLAKVTEALVRLGMHPFISGLTLSSWMSHLGQVVPWLESGEGIIDRQQCEAALVANSGTAHNILELLGSTLAAEFRVQPPDNLTAGSVIGCGLPSFSIVYETARASCRSNFFMLSSAIKYPERCRCEGHSKGSEGSEMVCLDAIPKRCIPTSAIYPLARTVLSDKHSVLIPTNPYSISSLDLDNFMKQLKCMQSLPGGGYEEWSAVWVPQMSTIEKWFKASMAVLLVTHVAFFAFLRVRRKPSGVSSGEQKYIE